ncbi:MAG: thioredoxin domain-containing protein [Candidatus Krumholzibacteriia bacterium]
MNDDSSPPEHRRAGNRLKDEPSLYLRQHAHNPVDWYPWGEEAVARAHAEDRPVFLSVGYASCHWCHVMEQEVFEDDEVAAFLNDRFVCIKVDREERPDLDRVYMEAVQAMTGRGGWPMSVFLTPDLEPFYGGTYFPRLQFLGLIRQIDEVFRTRRSDLENQAAQLAAGIRALPAARVGAGPGLSLELADAAVAGAWQYFDTRNGGFNQRQKFPTPVKWRFLLRTYRRTGDRELGDMIRKTCDAMAGGGIYDHVGGGFHRYTVDEDWTVPHFEKMLYDNAQLAGLFIEAGVAFDRGDYLDLGRDVLDFLMREMRGKDGGFYASYDADSGGEEGSYYVWSPEEIVAVAGPADGPPLAELLGVGPRGNFEHGNKSVLTRRADVPAIAAAHGWAPDEVDALFPRWRGALREARDGRVPPGLDRKIVTSWNGLAISALAQAHAATGDPACLKGALRAADFLLASHLRPDGSLWRTTSDGRPAGEGILDDYAMLADGLLDLYQVCDDQELQVKYLGAARRLIDFARHEFGRAEGGYYLSRDGADAPLGRTVETFDNVEPSGMATLYQALIKAAAITGDTGYLEEVHTGLQDWSGLMERAGIEMALWCDAVTRITVPFHDAVVAGDGPEAEAMAREVLVRLPHQAVLSRLPADGAGADLLALAPALAGKSGRNGGAAGYVCSFGVCSEPVTSPEALLERLNLSVPPGD